MRIRRLASGSLSGLLLCAAGLVVATDASAVPPLPPSQPAAVYPPVSEAVGVSTTDVRVGETITVTANGFKPLSAATVTTSLGGVPGTGKAPGSAAAAGQPFQVYPATADSLGVVTASVKFDEPGDHTVTISGISPTGVPRSVTTELTVQSAAAPVPGAATTLRPVQGEADKASNSLLQYGALGVGAIVLIGLGVVARRLRSARKSAPARRKAPPPTGSVLPTPARPGSAYPPGHPSTFTTPQAVLAETSMSAPPATAPNLG